MKEAKILSRLIMEVINRDLLIREYKYYSAGKQSTVEAGQYKNLLFYVPLSVSALR